MHMYSCYSCFIFELETPRRKKAKTADANVASLLNIAEDIQAAIVTTPRKLPMGSADAFGSFVASLLAEMTPEVRKEKMKKINNVLFE